MRGESAITVLAAAHFMHQASENGLKSSKRNQEKENFWSGHVAVSEICGDSGLRYRKCSIVTAVFSQAVGVRIESAEGWLGESFALR